MQKVREPAVAGMFYPARENDLKDQLRLLFDVTEETEKFNNSLGIVVPHAGYAYSGKTAAFGYSSISENNYNTFIIVSPSHREYFPGISVYNGDAYKTPFGIVPVNKELRSRLVESSESIFEGIEGHRSEHALEVQIPFLQYMFDDFSIVPVVLGNQGKVFIDELAKTLNNVVDENTLIVVSSDMSHFYSKEEADKFDSLVVKRIEDFDFEKLQIDLETGNCHACGGGGIVSLLKTGKLKGYNKSKVVHRSDSGDTTKDNSEVVGYLSAVIYD